MSASIMAPTPVVSQDTYAGRGYFISCGDEGCFINSDGYDLFVPEDGNAWMLSELPTMTAVEVEGTISDVADASALLWLTSVKPLADDLYQANLEFMQGEWQPVGEDTPFFVGIYGMEWNEFLMEEESDRFMMSVGDACANGLTYEGMVISLYRYGDDPDADACWQLEYIDERSMTLRDLSGDFGAIEFEKVQH